jgi:hypothetical protein
VKPYYQDESVTLYLGDCRDVLVWLEANVVITDPPYGIGWKRGVNHQRASKAHAGILNDHDTSTRDEALALAAGRPCVVFGSFYAPFPADVTQVLVWHKPSDSGVVGSTTGFRRDAEPIFLVGDWPQRSVRWSSVLRGTERGIAAVVTATGHPHTKPGVLMRQLVDSCPDGVIADPFAGSGSTLRAAKDRGRRAIGVEISEAYCEIAARRLSQGTLSEMFT